MNCIHDKGKLEIFSAHLLSSLYLYPCLNARQELYRVAEVSAQFRDHVADGLLPRLVKPLGHLVELLLQEVLHFFHLLPKGHNTV